MAQVLTITANDTTVPAAQALRTLRTTTEEALQRAFASGCLIDPDLKVVDKPSERHALYHFSGQPVKNHRAMLQLNKPEHHLLPIVPAQDTALVP